MNITYLPWPTAGHSTPESYRRVGAFLGGGVDLTVGRERGE